MHYQQFGDMIVLCIADLDYPFRLGYDFISEVQAEVKKLISANGDSSTAKSPVSSQTSTKFGNNEKKAIPKILYNLIVCI